MYTIDPFNCAVREKLNGVIPAAEGLDASALVKLVLLAGSLLGVQYGSLVIC